MTGGAQGPKGGCVEVVFTRSAVGMVAFGGLLGASFQPSLALRMFRHEDPSLVAIDLLSQNPCATDPFEPTPWLLLPRRALSGSFVSTVCPNGFARL